MTTEKTFPKFENTATIEGTVYSSTIVQKDDFKDKDNKSYTALTGRIVVRTGENESHTANVFVKEFTNSGAPSKSFVSISKVLETMITIEEISDPKINTPENAQPSRVRIKGELNLNEYYNDADLLQSQLQVKASYISRIQPEDEFNPRAEYDVEGIVIGNKPEVTGEDSDETGRQIVKLMIPTWNNALPVEMVSRNNEQDKEYIESNFEVGTSVNLYGKIVNFSKKIEKKIEAGFGEDKVEVKYENTREVQITGGKVYDEESDKAITQEQFNELRVKRETALATLKEKHEAKKANGNKTGAKQAGFSGNAVSGGVNKAKPKVDVSGLF